MALKGSENKTDKEKRIAKEFSRLKKIFKNLPENSLNVSVSLLKNAAFMTVTLEDLQETINKDGTVQEYQNGKNQWGVKKSPEVEIYNTMIKNHSTIIRQMIDLIPSKEQGPVKEELDEFQEFLLSGKNG